MYGAEQTFDQKTMATVRVPSVVPLAFEDCEGLNKAFKGWGTDEKAIIRILGKRNTSQKREIRETYHQRYNKLLIDELHSELSGHFLKAVSMWAQDPAERDARLANEALKSWKKGINQLQIIIEISCANSPHHLMAVRQAYCSLFETSLEEDIISNAPLSVQKILVGLVSSYRYDKEVVDLNIADLEAFKLHEAIDKKLLDDDHFLWIFSTRNFFQLKATFKSYQLQFGSPIYQDIKKCGNDILESVLGVVVLCIDSPEKHFAEVIRASIIGLGTDEDSLTRAIVSRAEIDMMKIREEYLIINKTSLDDAVSGDTSGDYKDFLMTLLGAEI